MTFPSIEEHRLIDEIKREKQKEHLRQKRSAIRKNNRKNTRGRHTQYIKYFDFSNFPPKLKTRTIKHFNRI